MKTFNQLLSYLIIFQLCFACNGGGGASSGGLGSGSSSSINFSGSLAKAFNSFSDLLVGQAMAQGELNITDITDPNNQKNLGTYEIEDETQPFNFNLTADQVSEKVIELHFIGNEKSLLGERILIIKIESGQTNIELPVINSDETVAAKILKARIEAENIVDEDEIKSRFKKFVENKEMMKEILSEIGANSYQLLKHMKEEPSSTLTLAFASAFAAKVEESDDSTMTQELENLNRLASEKNDVFIGPVLSCSSSSAKFYSPTEEDFKIIITPLSSGLVADHGKESIEVATRSTLDEVNTTLNDVIEKFKIESENYKDLQSFVVYVTNQIDFKAGCKFSAKASAGFDISLIELFTPVRGHSFDEMINNLYDTFQRVKDEGAVYVQKQVELGNFDDHSAKKYQFSKLMEGISAVNAKWDSLDAQFNKSQFKIDVSKMRSLSCTDFSTQDDFNQALQDATKYTYQSYVEKYAEDEEIGSAAYSTSYGRFKYLHSYLYETCLIYFELIQSQASKEVSEDLANASKIESAERTTSTESAKKIYQPE